LQNLSIHARAAGECPAYEAGEMMVVRHRDDDPASFKENYDDERFQAGDFQPV